MSSLVVGLGRRGRLHVDALSQFPDLLPVYVFDPRVPARPSSMEGIALIDDWSAAVRLRNTDLAVIASPPPTHAQYVIEMGSIADKILLEKPSASSRDDLERMKSLPRSLRDRVFVGYSERHNPITFDARQALTHMMRSRGVHRVQFRRCRPLTQVGEDAQDVGAELAVHDLDFVLNHALPGYHEALQRAAAPQREFALTGSVGDVRAEFYAAWTDGESVSEAEVTMTDGTTHLTDLSSGGREGRMAALHQQLEHVLNSAHSQDLDKDERVLEVLFRES
jgi:predicted dehydrogenase